MTDDPKVGYETWQSISASGDPWVPEPWADEPDLSGVRWAVAIGCLLLFLAFVWSCMR